MIKKIYIFISIIFVFLACQKLCLDSESDIKIKKNIDFSVKKALDLDVEIKKGIFKKNIFGLMFIENNNYRIFLYKENIKKIDIGCNEKYFWYWSAQESQDTLFYSENKNKDLVLKRAYNPSWMFNCFKNLDKKGQSFLLTLDSVVVSKATILDNNIIEYNLIEEGIIIKITIKNVLNQNFDKDVFLIPINKFKNHNKMIPN